MSKRCNEIQKTFPPAPLTANEVQVLKKYEQVFEVSMKQKDLKGVLQDPPYPYYKKHCWIQLQWMKVDIKTKIQSIEKHAQYFLQRFLKEENPKDYHRYARLTFIVHSYKESGFSKETLTALYSSRHSIPKKLFPYEMGRICLMDAVKYGFIEEFLEMEKTLTPLQIQAHNNAIKQNFHTYDVE